MKLIPNQKRMREKKNKEEERRKEKEKKEEERRREEEKRRREEEERRREEERILSEYLQKMQEREANALAKRIAESAARPVKQFRSRIREFGLHPLKTEAVPFRLKRNEQVYFIAGSSGEFAFEIALALTNNRMFYSEHIDPNESFLNDVDRLTVVPGTRTVPLSSIIALDEPIPDTSYLIWAAGIHLANGTRIVLKFSSCDTSREFYSVIAELVDRLNDPIDEAAFTPTRERIPDEVKVAVWRRDRGVCVKCGSRNSLEYDHIIPVSKGGSNSVRNIELLCQSCNREKSDKIL